MKKTTEEKPITIESLDQLQTLVNETVQCRFHLDGKLISVPITRISPAVAEREREIRRMAQPPYKQDRKDYDPLDATYLKKRDEQATRARNFIVYSCCPAVASKKPGLTAPEDIHTFVQGLLTENILNFIALSAQGGGMDLDVEAQKGANFTQAPGSES